MSDEDSVCTYVIELVGHRVVKIGKTSNLYSRLASIQTSNPYEVRLVAALRGDVEEMLHVHLHKAGYHVRGEWFWHGPEVKRLTDLLDKCLIWPEARTIIGGR